jgi:hypothetical protein
VNLPVNVTLAAMMWGLLPDKMRARREQVDAEAAAASGATGSGADEGSLAMFMMDVAGGSLRTRGLHLLTLELNLSNSKTRS